MKLTSRSEYALLAMVHLARCPTGEFVSVEAIAHAQGIPKKFLEQIMLLLKRDRCVRSAKGNRGGYQLARPADEIFLSEIIRLFDGALAPTESVSKYFYESTPIEREEKLVGVLRDIRDYISDKLESTTIEKMK
ncbi:MAG: Rrf2 family transcriptional regulator [Verrucomicrobiae bacterium]